MPGREPSPTPCWLFWALTFLSLGFPSSQSPTLRTFALEPSSEARAASSLHPTRLLDLAERHLRSAAAHEHLARGELVARRAALGDLIEGNTVFFHLELAIGHLNAIVPRGGHVVGANALGAVGHVEGAVVDKRGAGGGTVPRLALRAKSLRLSRSRTRTGPSGSWARTRWIWEASAGWHRRWQTGPPGRWDTGRSTPRPRAR